MRSRIMVAACAAVLASALAPAVRADELSPERAWTTSAVASVHNIFDGEIAGVAPGQSVVTHWEPGAIVASVRDAATGLSTDQTLATGAVFLPSLAGSYAGGAVVAWEEDDDRTIAVAERRAGATAFTPSFEVDTCCGDFSGNRPLVAVGRRGDAVVGWVAADPDPDSDVQHVMASYRPVGGDFGAPEEIATATATGLRDVALGSDGTVALAWIDGGQAEVAVRAPATGAWSAPAALGAPEHYPLFDSPSIAVDGAGRVVAAWRDGLPGGDVDGAAPVEVAFRGAGATAFGPPHDAGVRADVNGPGPEVVVSDAGEVVLAVQAASDLPHGGIHMEGIWVAFGTTVREDLGAPAAVTDFWGESPALSTDARGDAIVAWSRCCTAKVGIRRRSPGGSFDVAVEVPTAAAGAVGMAYVNDAAVDDAGNAGLVFPVFASTPDTLFAAADGPIVTAPLPDVASVPLTLPAVLGPGVLAEGGAAGNGGPVRMPPYPVYPVAPGPQPRPLLPKASAPPKRLVLHVGARLVGPRTHRSVEVRVRCSEACRAGVAATLATKYHLKGAALKLARKGETRVKLTLPKRKLKKQAWLVVKVAATSASGRHARATARVRVPSSGRR